MGGATGRRNARLKGQHGGDGGWQDIRSMHDLGASDENNAPWRQDLRSMYSLTAFCTAKRIHGDQSLPRLALFGYIAAIYCREVAFFLSEAPQGIRDGNLLPWPDAEGEHTARRLTRSWQGAVRRGSSETQGAGSEDAGATGSASDNEAGVRWGSKGRRVVSTTSAGGCRAAGR